MSTSAPAPARAVSGLAFLTLLLIALLMGANHVAARLAFDHGVDVATAVTFRSAVTALVLAGLLLAAAEGTLGAHPPLQWRDGYAITVVLAAAGYPQNPRTGDPISGADQPGVLHAGTTERDGRVVSSGGRVLNVVATGGTLAQAREKAYSVLSSIDLSGSHYRTDIAQKASQ